MPDLTYDPSAPQEGDSEILIDHKTAVNVATIATAISGIAGPSTLDDIIALIGTADDAAGANTIIGQLKQIAVNTTPVP